MKKITITALISILVAINIAFIVTCVVFSLPKKPKNGALYIDGVYITDENVLIYPDSSEFRMALLFILKQSDQNTILPVTVVLKNLGMEVEWIDDNFAEISYKDETYTLDLQEAAIIGEEGNLSWIVPDMSYKILEKELLLDYGAIVSFMRRIDERVLIDVDYDNLTVNK